MTHNPTIPSPRWGSAVVDDEKMTQLFLCVNCGPTVVPDRIVMISGTTYCPLHAREILAK